MKAAMVPLGVLLPRGSVGCSCGGWFAGCVFDESGICAAEEKQKVTSKTRPMTQNRRGRAWKCVWRFLETAMSCLDAMVDFAVDLRQRSIGSISSFVRVDEGANRSISAED